MLHRASPATHRHVRLSYAGQTLSNVGTQIQLLGQVWPVPLLSSDPFLLGVVTADDVLELVVNR